MAHILLIDDERKLTDPLRSSFERGGYQVTVANDGHAGLSLVLVEKPDVVVLDVMMPGLDGWQVCQAIRTHSTMPIIMLTALDAPTVSKAWNLARMTISSNHLATRNWRHMYGQCCAGCALIRVSSFSKGSPSAKSRLIFRRIRSRGTGKKSSCARRSSRSCRC